MGIFLDARKAEGAERGMKNNARLFIGVVRDNDPKLLRKDLLKILSLSLSSVL